MNARQLVKLGVPESCCAAAIRGIQAACAQGASRGRDMRQQIAEVLANPSSFENDGHFGELARELLSPELSVKRTEPLVYRTWGARHIDEASHAQMRQACELPRAVGAALMPDAHVGYGLPIGGVLALDNAVVPYAVGVDIACRMKLSVLDVPVQRLEQRKHFEPFRDALERGTRFGVGVAYDTPHDHPVMDADWSVSRITRENKAKAWKQLGTSGSGNHFVEFGVLTLGERQSDIDLEPGEYVALLSHSGSRGVGASVCSTYSAIAQSRLSKHEQHFGRLAWLDLDSEAGQEYWAAMNLMGDYAAANHDVIHRQVSKLLGGRIIAGIENHHNFAWKEQHNGREVIVHRKGATPAGPGALGVIPGSMATPAYVVRGKGNAESLHSASHGAGRLMLRTAALGKFTWKAVQRDLEKRGVHVLSAGADEVPYVYKNIDDVIAEQTELVEVLARFDPRIVKMCGDGSKAED